jgi:hypothetical protein
VLGRKSEWTYGGEGGEVDGRGEVVSIEVPEYKPSGVPELSPILNDVACRMMVRGGVVAGIERNIAYPERSCQC